MAYLNTYYFFSGGTTLMSTLNFFERPKLTMDNGFTLDDRRNYDAISLFVLRLYRIGVPFPKTMLVGTSITQYRNGQSAPYSKRQFMPRT